MIRIHPQSIMLSAAICVTTARADVADVATSEAPVNAASVARDVTAVLDSWGHEDASADRDSDGVVGMQDLLLALTGQRGVRGASIIDVRQAGIDTAFVRLSCEVFSDPEWSKHGYDGLVTYRVYAVFEPGSKDQGVLSPFGLRETPMSMISSYLVMHNDLVADSLTAPVDLRGAGIWSNQWDTYVTINATEAAGDATHVSPTFDDATKGLGRSFVLTNDGWYVTPDDAQHLAVDDRVLLGQFSVDEGGELGGTWNLLLAGGTGVLQTPCFCTTSGTTVGACCRDDGRDCLVVSANFCENLGGTFRGAGTDCVRQIVDTPCHPSDSAQHCVRIISTCPEEGDAPGVDCEPGPLLDAWASPEGEHQNTYHDFGASGQAIPADFFGPGSDPVTAIVTFRSVPIGGKFGDVDTLIERSADPFDRCALPSPVSVEVDIHLAELSLESTEPIEVTYNKGQDAEAWNVRLALSPTQPPPGTLLAKKTTCNGGTYAVETLFVQPLFTFTRVEDPKDSIVFDTGKEGLDPVVLSLDEGHWVSDVDPGIVVFSPYCTDFHPGLSDNTPPADCDCNANEQRDQCDIDDGISLDCDADAVPDECQLARGARDCNKNGTLDSCECPGDVVGNCEMGHADVLAVLAAWGVCDGCPEDVTRDGLVGMADLLEILRTWGPCG